MIKRIISLFLICSLLTGIVPVLSEDVAQELQGITGFSLEPVAEAYTELPESELSAETEHKISPSKLIAVPPFERTEVYPEETGYSLYQLLPGISERLGKINSRDSIALENRLNKGIEPGDNIGSEYIDPLTGNLTVTETDLCLPGRDGFDFVLSRYYSSSQAEFYSKELNITEGRRIRGSKINYIVTETVTDGNGNIAGTYTYPYSDRLNAEKRVREIQSRNNENEGYTYSAEKTEYTSSEAVELPYTFTSKLTVPSYTIRRNGLGAGWSWSFPSVQAFKTDYTDEAEIPSAIYYHDGKGNIFEIAKNDYEYYFKNYTGNDMSFEYAPHYDGSSSRIDYTVEDADLKTYYFGPYGEIRKITDAYGNEINFQYNSGNSDGVTLPVLTRIIDSVGRIISFSWLDDKSVRVTVKESENAEESISFSYHREIRRLDGENGNLSQPVLAGITDAEGNYTGYAYAYDKENEKAQNFWFNLADKSFDSTYEGYCEGYTNLLTGIYRPSSITDYGYELNTSNLGKSGISHNFRVISRRDWLCKADADGFVQLNNKMHNPESYQYVFKDYTGYPDYDSQDEMKNGATICTIRYSKNDEFKYIYRKTGGIFLPDSITSEYDSGLVIAQTHRNYYGFNPIETEITYSDEGSEYTSYIYRQFSDTNDKSKGKLTLETRELAEKPDGIDALNMNPECYEYNSDGFITSKSWYKDENTQCTESYSYDENKRLTKVIDAGGVATDYSYEYAGGRVSKRIAVTQNEGQSLTVTETYTADTNYAYPSTVTKTVDGKTETTSYTYNMLLGTVATVTDTNGKVTSYEYDNLGRVTKITYPEYEAYTTSGIKNSTVYPVEETDYCYVRLEYDSEQIVLQRIRSTLRYCDASGNINHLSENIEYYAGTGELFLRRILDKTAVDSPLNYTTEKYFYNIHRTQITVTDSLGNTTVTKYDGLGREISFKDEFDNLRITEYNIDGSIPGLKVKSYFVPSTNSNAKENVVENTYDRWQRLISEKAYAGESECSEIKYSYDIAGNVTSVTDANGNESSYEYDNLNRAVSSTNPYNELQAYEYDNAGNIKRQYVSSQKLFERSYDGEGKLLTDTDNAGNSNIYSYNSKGQIIARQDKAEKLYNAYYNCVGNVEKEVYLKSGSSLAENYYGYYTPYGNTVLSFRGIYDEEENAYVLAESGISRKIASPGGSLLYSQIITDEGFNPEISYAYDSEGRILSSEYTVNDDKFTVGYEYDKSRPAKVRFDGNKEAEYEFYPDGKLKKITYPGGVLKSEYAYDGLSRLTSLINYKGNEILSSYTYTYDKNGNILTVNESVGSKADTVNYTYDKLNRISTVSGTKGANSYYEYDSRGNRKVNFEQIDFLSEESASFTYDERDRLTASQVGEISASYSYSPDGYRLRKNSEYYIYDELGRLVAEYEKDGSEFSMSRQYIWGPDRVLAQKDALSGNIYYYLYNGHGDVIQITDSNGNIVNSYDYDVWGNFLEKEETIDNPFTYFGQTYDEETGLYYLRARYYDPATSRMLSEDPIKQGLNWYVYCNNNPLKYIDPSGLYYLEKDNNGQVYAVIQSGDTLSGIALSEVGNANAYTKITGVSDYNNIHIGQRVNITAIYNDINFTKKSTGSKHKMPDTGDPNSKDTIYNPDGTPKQERYYGPDGNPSYDDDYNHGGDGHGIGFPHRHPWINGKRQKQPIPIPSENISRNESMGVLVIGGIVTLIELVGYYYGVPIDLPGN